MGVHKQGKRNRKIGRSARKPCNRMQYFRTYTNKLARVNRDRAKSGKPALASLSNYDALWHRIPHNGL